MQQVLSLFQRHTTGKEDGDAVFVMEGFMWKILYMRLDSSTPNGMSFREYSDSTLELETLLRISTMASGTLAGEIGRVYATRKADAVLPCSRTALLAVWSAHTHDAVRTLASYKHDAFWKNVSHQRSV